MSEPAMETLERVDNPCACLPLTFTSLRSNFSPFEVSPITDTVDVS